MINSDAGLDDTYYTIESNVRVQQKISASTFIATAVPVQTKDQAIEELHRIQHEFADATHNCFAYRLGVHGLEFRTADDHEPRGTAGKPILFAIQKYSLSDILVVVTRYYGGTKLGRARLATAYASSADMVLSTSERKRVARTCGVKVLCVYEDLKFVLPIIERMAVHISSDYRDAIEFHVLVRLSDVPSFVEQITECTKARAGCIVDPVDVV